MIQHTNGSLRAVASAALVLSGFSVFGCVASTEELETFEAEEQALIISGVTFQTVGVPRYLGAQNNGGSTVNATANAAQAWETFRVDDINGGALNSGDSVFIQTGNGRYFQAVNGGGSTLNAASTNRLGWETFRIVKESGSGVINNGDVVGIQASNGRFVRALNGGGSTVDAQGAALGGWERLRIGGLGSTQPSACSGIQSGAACCPSSCGACGGTGCGDRPGGSNACCTGPILSANVSCSGSQPPCVTTSTPTPPPPSSGFSSIVSRAQFEAIFPNRNGFYTYDGLVQAAAIYPTFANQGSTDVRKQEAAAFLANVAHETGHLIYIEEINKGDYMSWNDPGCQPAPGQRYFGRGPLQLSWNYNYCAASQSIFGDRNVLRTDPGRVARESRIAWATALWFWMTQTGAGSITGHNAMVQSRGFGETIRTINGSLECNGRNPGTVQTRINYYQNIIGRLGSYPGSNLSC